MTIDKLKPGMIVYDVHSYPMGNTTMRTMGTWTVKVLEVVPDSGVVIASWNSNPPNRYYEHTWKKWRLKKPLLINDGMGRYRLATREESKRVKDTRLLT